MATRSIRAALIVLLLATSGAPLEAQTPSVFLPQGPSTTNGRPGAALVKGPRLIVAATNDATSGALVELLGEWDPRGTPPILELLGRSDGARRLRRFGGQLFALNRSAGTVRRVPLNGGASQSYDFGSGSEPMDILVPGGPAVAPPAAPVMAMVSLRNETRLLKLDLGTGVTQESVDLSAVGGGASIALGTMLRHGSRLFVQVRVFDDQDVPGGDTGVLAVVDLVTETLVDADPDKPGTQGVALMGAPPRFDMQVVENSLYVSTTETFNDVRGGIERVDLTTLTSMGYVISEASGHSDMGGFVMLDATRGYYVFHTDLLASAHLVSFSVAGGPEPGSLIDLLGDTVDQMVYDAKNARLYLPSGFATNGPGLYAFSTESNALLGPPLMTGLRPHDVVLVQAALPFEAGL